MIKNEINASNFQLSLACFYSHGFSGDYIKISNKIYLFTDCYHSLERRDGLFCPVEIKDIQYFGVEWINISNQFLLHKRNSFCWLIQTHVICFHERNGKNYID